MGGVSQSFRAPSLNDTAGITPTGSAAALDLPSPGLDPERGLHFEIGARTRHGKYEAGVFAFYTEIYDIIRRVPAGDVDGDTVTDFTKTNLAFGVIYGIELYGRMPLGEEVTVFGSFAWLKGFAEEAEVSGGVIVDTPLHHLRAANPAKGLVGVKWEPKGHPIWVEVLVHMVATQDKLSNEDIADNRRIPAGGTPGFSLLTLRCGVEFSPHVRGSFSVENLTNVDYRFHASGQNEPGTNLIVSLDARY
jgi:outer membrane receptor protein involved in Fe transport